MKFFKKSRESEVFFVRGFQRSGTNWVCNLLNLHPDINCVGEFHWGDLFQANKKLLNRKFGLISRKPKGFEGKVESIIKDSIIEHCDYYPKCGDRTPEALQNVLIPHCKYFLIHRDPRDVLVSWIYHLFKIDFPFGSDMEKKKLQFRDDDKYFEEHKQELFNMHWTRKIATDWNKRVKMDVQCMNDVAKRKQPIDTYLIQYEDLLKNTDTIRKKMYLFLNCDPKKAKGLSDLTKPGFESHDPNSHYRIGQSGRWRSYFDEEHLQVFETVAKEGMELMGYQFYSN